MESMPDGLKTNSTDRRQKDGAVGGGIARGHHTLGRMPSRKVPSVVPSTRMERDIALDAPGSGKLSQLAVR
jgi:hypothetical protein